MFSDVLRLPPGPVDLTAIETDAAPGYDGDKKTGKKALCGAGCRALRPPGALCTPSGTPRAVRSVLLVLQGMDTSGKGGVLRHTVGLMDPQGVKITTFKAPTEEERRTTSCGGSARRCRKPGSSACSTARTTRTS